MKIVKNLEKLNFRNTGHLNNTCTFERNYIIVLAIYHRLGRYDPSDKLVQTY